MRRFLEILGVILFQFIAILSVTYLVSLLVYPLVADPVTQSGNYMLFIGLSIILGVFLAGWLAFRLHWLVGRQYLLARLAATALGAYLPMLAVLLVLKTIPAGHPVFSIAMFSGILGFYLAGWLMQRRK